MNEPQKSFRGHQKWLFFGIISYSLILRLVLFDPPKFCFDISFNFASYPLHQPLNDFVVKAYFHICDSELDCSSILSVRQGKFFFQVLHLDLFIYHAVKIKLFRVPDSLLTNWWHDVFFNRLFFNRKSKSFGTLKKESKQYLVAHDNFCYSLHSAPMWAQYTPPLNVWAFKVCMVYNGPKRNRRVTPMMMPRPCPSG